jgi:ubiquitin carboxyl-terminal hydrolase 7
VNLLVSRQATFEDVRQALIKKLTSIPTNVHSRLRIFDTRNHRDYKEFQPQQPISPSSVDAFYGANLFVEPIPTEEDEATEWDRFIVVVHLAKDVTRLHGVPVKFMVKPVCVLLSLLKATCDFLGLNMSYFKDRIKVLI